MAGDPGQVSLDHPAAGQDFEGVQVIGAFDDLQGDPQRGRGPGDQLAGVAAVGQASLTVGKAFFRFHSSGLAASRSCTEAAVTSTVSSRPRARRRGAAWCR